MLRHDQASAWVDRWGREPVTRALRETIAEVRSALQGGDSAALSADLLEKAFRRLSTDRASLRPVVNGTGVILHTNLGRAPLASVAARVAAEIAGGYSSLEYDLQVGERGDRYLHCADLLSRLTGAESSLVVNNNAAAVMLVLNTLARRKEVPVSRGELIEIGGAFRIPDIMSRSGCKLVEVGTTN
ncbi:MAG: L-seryl-tRNA(Sec) selenium transferase, partial [Gemmatimonadetes bacterium]|nr:L-seryl-tRNA(Sec) selenium transferase [Gemmatimonadota bacterium]